MNKDLKELFSPHVDSFNHFLETLPELVSKIPPYEIKDDKNTLLIYVSEFTITKPFLNEKEYLSLDRRLMPRECRNRMTSYKGRAIIKFNFVLNNELVHTEEKSNGYFPVMVKSNLCHLNERIKCKNKNYKEMNLSEETKKILKRKNLLEKKTNIFYGDSLEEKNESGGYFIINGLEKVFRLLIVQKRNFIFAQNKNHYTKKGKNLSPHSVIMRCVGKDEIANVISLHYTNDGNILLKVKERRSEFFIPLMFILKGMTNVCDEELFNKIVKDSKNELLRSRVLLFLRKSLQNKLKIDEEEKREVSEVEYLGSIFKTLFRERGLDSKEACERLFGLIACHLENYHDKVNFLVLAIRKLILLVNSEIKEDDPDDPSNHEVIGVSHLLSFIVKEKLNETLRNLVFTYAKKKGELNVNLIRNLAKKIEPMVCQKVENFLATGNFNTLSCSDVLQDKGFVILAERLNFLRFISHFRCVNRGSFFTNVKTITVRKLRPESYGFICPVHTPDGTPCGILNHLSSEATVIYKNQPFNTSIFSQFGVSHQQFGLPVVLDGKVMGYSKNTKLLAQKIREEREKVEVALLPEGLFIFKGVGRYSRAIINLQTKKEEHIGIMEQLYLKIIPYNKKVTDFKEEIFYQEKSMTSFLSLTASLTPFSDYNQSPRNVYQCQMAKQSMGINCHSLKYRNDSKTYQHFYNQIPIVQTNNYSKYDLQDYPLGVNTIIAVLSYTAYDMEDAMIINKSSKERGMFNGFVYKTEIIHLEKNQNLIEIIEEGTFLTPNSFFYSFSEFNEKKVKNYNGMEGGFVDKIILADSLIIVRLRIERNPNIGDKFCSRHGQKGVCSFHYPAVDLPFSESGLVPDVIINPHAFPSRMTIGMMIESLAGKSGCLLGKIQNGNSFMKYEMEDESVNQTNNLINQTNNSVNQTNLENSFDDKNSHPKLISHFGNELLKCGFNYFGNETMYSGVTGTPFKTDIFIGVVYYQRLRHMVNDKFQVRIQGPVQPQTKQPIKGRIKLGGVRLGEMERDALLAHGASYILNDRFMTCSDGTLFYYCVSCKSILFSNKEGCLCGNKIIKEVYLPYVYKYLCTELMAMNVRVRLE